MFQDFFNSTNSFQKISMEVIAFFSIQIMVVFVVIRNKTQVKNQMKKLRKGLMMR